MIKFNFTQKIYWKVLKWKLIQVLFFFIFTNLIFIGIQHQIGIVNHNHYQDLMKTYELHEILEFQSIDFEKINDTNINYANLLNYYLQHTLNHYISFVSFRTNINYHLLILNGNLSNLSLTINQDLTTGNLIKQNISIITEDQFFFIDTSDYSIGNIQKILNFSIDQNIGFIVGINQFYQLLLSSEIEIGTVDLTLWMNYSSDIISYTFFDPLENMKQESNRLQSESYMYFGILPYVTFPISENIENNNNQLMNFQFFIEFILLIILIIFSILFYLLIQDISIDLKKIKINFENRGSSTFWLSNNFNKIIFAFSITSFLIPNIIYFIIINFCYYNYSLLSMVLYSTIPTLLISILLFFIGMKYSFPKEKEDEITTNAKSNKKLIILFNLMIFLVGFLMDFGGNVTSSNKLQSNIFYIIGSLILLIYFVEDIFNKINDTMFQFTSRSRFGSRFLKIIHTNISNKKNYQSILRQYLLLVFLLFLLLFLLFGMHNITTTHHELSTWGDVNYQVSTTYGKYQIWNEANSNMNIIVSPLSLAAFSADQGETIRDTPVGITDSNLFIKNTKFYEFYKGKLSNLSTKSILVSKDFAIENNLDLNAEYTFWLIIDGNFVELTAKVSGIYSSILPFSYSDDVFFDILLDYNFLAQYTNIEDIFIQILGISYQGTANQNIKHELEISLDTELKNISLNENITIQSLQQLNKIMISMFLLIFVIYALNFISNFFQSNVNLIEYDNNSLILRGLKRKISRNIILKWNIFTTLTIIIISVIIGLVVTITFLFDVVSIKFLIYILLHSISTIVLSTISLIFFNLGIMMIKLKNI